MKELTSTLALVWQFLMRIRALMASLPVACHRAMFRESGKNRTCRKSSTNEVNLHKTGAANPCAVNIPIAFPGDQDTNTTLRRRALRCPNMP